MSAPKREPRILQFRVVLVFLFSVVNEGGEEPCSLLVCWLHLGGQETVYVSASRVRVLQSKDALVKHCPMLPGTVCGLSWVLCTEGSVVNCSFSFALCNCSGLLCFVVWFLTVSWMWTAPVEMYGFAPSDFVMNRNHYGSVNRNPLFSHFLKDILVL